MPKAVIICALVASLCGSQPHQNRPRPRPVALVFGQVQPIQKTTRTDAAQVGEIANGLHH